MMRARCGIADLDDIMGGLPCMERGTAAAISVPVEGWCDIGGDFFVGEGGNYELALPCMLRGQRPVL
ncbi:MAG: hypothetical protein JO237_03570 [Pseudolabrys sp.]|nr:hypothetical protein [Pseudolabrys sp.]